MSSCLCALWLQQISSPGVDICCDTVRKYDMNFYYYTDDSEIYVQVKHMNI